MSSRARRRHFAVGILSLLVSFPATAKDTALMVTYGRDAPEAEGDDDHLQTIFLALPEDASGDLYVRLFDADCGGRNDSIYGAPDTRTRFSLYGGVGAAADEPSAGTLLGEETWAEDPAADDAWRTLARVTPGDGEATPTQRVFKLVVAGESGNDGNAFDVTVSASEEDGSPVPGLRMTHFSPTFRLAGSDPTAELIFFVPAGENELRIRNFDAAGAPVSLETASRTVPLRSSGQGTWAETEVALEEAESGRPAALILATGGDEQPNDVVFSVAGATSGPLAIEWPARIRASRARVAAETRTSLLADCHSVLFEATSGGAQNFSWANYSWEFGDGASASGSHVVHRYAEPGVYRARLTAAAADDPVGTLFELPVKVNRPPAAVAGSDQVVAPGDEVRFDGSASSDPDGRLTRFLWDFGDGESGEGRTAVHVFRLPGIRTVTLRVEDDAGGPCDFATDQLVVRVNDAPVAVAGEDAFLAVGQTIAFDAGRSYDKDGRIASFAWDFGDGESGAGESVEKAYSRPGTYTATLTVEDEAGVSNSTATDRVTVVVNDPPRAEAGDDRRLAVGEMTLFDGSASSDPDGQIVDFSWEFGDGNRGQGPKIPYAYRQPGSYGVTLTVRDDSPTSSGTASDGLTVMVNAPPLARAGGDQVVTASEVRLDASASSDADGAIAEYRWDFGDGTRGSGPSPVHVYPRPGHYEVTLTVVDDSGTPRNDDIDSLSVVVNHRPLADAGPDRTVAPGEEVRLSGAASLDPDGEIAGYSWQLGDGTSADGATATHAYAKPGTYVARLAVRDDTGDPWAVDYDEAVVRVNAPPVAVAGADVVVAPGQEVAFDAGASYDPDGSISSYRWDFSDGLGDDGSPLVRRSFATPGIYTARLAITDASGARNGRATDELTVRVNHAPRALPGADVATCASAVVLDGSASTDGDGDALTFTWDLGDGATGYGASVEHVYAEGGAYPVTLTVDDGQGLDNSRDTASTVVRVLRNPIAAAGGDRTACAGEVVLFDASASADPDGGLLRYRWDFGDGESAEGVNPTQIYTRGGTYGVTLSVEDDSGLPCDADSDRIFVRVAESPTAEAGADMKVCANTAVRFDGSGSRDFDGVVNRYDWSFGDGRRGGGARPEHVYAEPGTYRVRLTVTGDQVEECDNTDADELTVEVLAAPAPRIAGPARVPVGRAVAFDGSGSAGGGAAITAWRWDFGDGESAEGETVSHTWNEPGRFPLSLTVETAGDTACSKVSSRQLVVVNQPPAAEAGADQVVGVDQLVELDGTASRDDDGVIVAYEWDLGDGETARGAVVRHRYRESGRFTARLRVDDDAELDNSRAEDSLTVTVNAAPVPEIEIGEPPCPGADVSLSAAGSRDPDGEIASYRWSFGDGDSAEGVEVAHAWARPGRYQLTLVADDGRGVANSRQQASRLVAVNQAPSAMAGPDRVVCPGEEVTFDGAGSRDPDGEIASARWTFTAASGSSAGADGLAVSHVFAEPGLYTAELRVDDDSGSACAGARESAAVKVNAAPVAAAGGDRQAWTGGAHDEVLFDAGASGDADGDPLSFVWDLGDGTRQAGAKVYHTYSRPGRYTVRLTVDDGTRTACGRSADELTVEVRPRHP